MEKFPTPESNQEFNETELALIENLRAKNPEAKQELVQWVAEQEAAADAIGTPDAHAQMRIRQAKLYMRAGFLREAWNTCDAVRVYAREVNRRDLFESTNPLMDELEASPDPDEPPDPA